MVSSLLININNINMVFREKYNIHFKNSSLGPNSPNKLDPKIVCLDSLGKIVNVYFRRLSVFEMKGGVGKLKIFDLYNPLWSRGLYITKSTPTIFWTKHY